MNVQNPEAAPLRKYRTVLELTQWEWRRLEQHALALGLPGHVLIEQVLRNLIYSLETDVGDPLPDEPPEDA